ncbi:methyl-accepting chemotaxis protein [Bacillus ectoiniformans]|nr:methyl-accepting chemotaxis protein [Bacillus ectoiniformans]MBM7648218.1 methyl-accepting chemotaxis protein [Bacillus ectoiniformans]
MKMKLKGKLLASYFLLITIPLIILAVTSYNMTSKALQKTIEHELKETTKQTALATNQTLDGAKSILSIISKNPIITEAAPAQNDQAKKTEAFNYIQQVQKENSSLFENILISNQDGQAFVMNSDMNANLDLSYREYVKQALAGKVGISDVLISKATNEPIVGVAFPLKNGSSIDGVVIGTINFGQITKHVENIKIGESGYAYMINQDGLIISHPVKEKVLKENLSNNNNQELKSLVDKMKAGKAGEGFYTYEDVYKFTSFQPTGNNWTIAVTANYDDYMAPALKIKKDSIILTVLSILAAVAIAYFIAMSIIKPIRHLQKSMELAGNGDLTVQTNIQSKDELGELSSSFNSMIHNQLNIISKVSSASDELAASSEEMAASTEQVTTASSEVALNTQQLARDAETGNHNVLEASQALLELSSLIQIAKNKATTADEHSQVTLTSATDGKQTVLNVINKMENIKSRTEETKNHISTLEEYTNEITVITDTITQIADQTNLLALNAAIEAARAGEAGKGFAVVADEVRKLAEQSNQGASEVAALVKKITETTADTVVATDYNRKEVDEGVAAVKRAEEALEAIVAAVEKTVDEVTGIVHVTDNEVATSEKIVELINSLASFIENTAANAEEVSASTEETSAAMQTIAATTEQVNAMAFELRESINTFKLHEEE